jgi:putative ABC transport system permease protein
MFGYYLGLALRSLRRNVVLTLLMIAAVGVGIGTSMTTLTVFRAMDADPIPGKSAQLFVPQIDNWGPENQTGAGAGPDHLQSNLSYTDVVNLMNAHAGRRQSAMYATALALTPSNPQVAPSLVHGRAAFTDFFAMFQVPFRYGSAWSADDDAAHAEVIVISRDLNDQMFGGVNSVGRTLNLDDHDYRVVGVIDRWDPRPRFFDLRSASKFGGTEDVYVPFTRAIEAGMAVWGNMSCDEEPAPGFEGILHSECIWAQFWVELPTAAAAADYRRFLDNYAADQQRAGRFHWPAHTALRDVRQWLVYQHVVSDEVRILVLVSFSFLFVCLLNAMGLLLAKIMGRAGEIGVRRALGADRKAIFVQCLVETGVIGLAGALLGLVLTLLGLLGLRTLLSEDLVALTHLDIRDVEIAIALGVLATVAAGLYPTWRASRVQPAWQLKSQ